jgi:hypothetical protein
MFLNDNLELFGHVEAPVSTNIIPFLRMSEQKEPGKSITRLPSRSGFMPLSAASES